MKANPSTKIFQLKELLKTAKRLYASWEHKPTKKQSMCFQTNQVKHSTSKLQDYLDKAITPAFLLSYLTE